MYLIHTVSCESPTNILWIAANLDFVQGQRMCWPVDIKLNQVFGTKMAGKQTEMIDNFC